LALGPNPFGTSLRLQSLSFRFFNHIKCNLRSRERPKPREVLAGAGTHGSTPRKYPVRRVISASQGHERASPLVHGDYVRRIGFRFSRRDGVCRIRLRSRGASMKESRRNTGDDDDQNGSHASSPVKSNDTQTPMPPGRDLPKTGLCRFVEERFIHRSRIAENCPAVKNRSLCELFSVC
jgi:hypothetical protein